MGYSNAAMSKVEAENLGCSNFCYRFETTVKLTAQNAEYRCISLHFVGQ